MFEPNWVNVISIGLKIEKAAFGYGKDACFACSPTE
jgi:hypothetical protein